MYNSISSQQLKKICSLLRFDIITATTEAASGHPTSSLSAVELMATLMFGGFFKAKLDDPDYPNNDRLIFSKGHASPLLYALYAIAGKVSHDELLTLRTFDSRLEGHPTMRFPYAEAATGSLGQGLSIGVGMAINAKYLDHLPYRTFVLLGDSEMAEGSNWEAIQLAAHYKLNNLIGIIDINRLGQRGETMYGWDITAYDERVRAFGWSTYVIEDGHNFEQVYAAFEFALQSSDKPVMIIAKTVKGKGVSLWENQENWHSKQLNPQQLEVAIKELGEIDKQIQGQVAAPEAITSQQTSGRAFSVDTHIEYKMYSTKEASGIAVQQLGKSEKTIVVLDAEVSNSTHAQLFHDAFPDRFFEMYIAEQNMVGTALGLSRRGKIPFVFTFAAFLTRAYDQIRMSQYSNSNVKFVGSYAGVSLGKDGASQMGLEDISMFRSIQGCLIFHPSDAVSTMQLIAHAAAHQGNVYVRTIREPLPILYDQTEEFHIGGSKTLRSSDKDVVTVVAAGITLHEALKAYDELQKEQITIRVIDLYSIAPIDVEALHKAAKETQSIIVVEDHYQQGGINEAVRTALGNESGKVYSMAVTKMPRSGKPEELLRYEEIDAQAITKKVKKLI